MVGNYDITIVDTTRKYYSYDGLEFWSDYPWDFNDGLMGYSWINMGFNGILMVLNRWWLNGI